ncbi:uncharacterized protein LOC119110107 [Pollicipes pollicipes]|uniref:uncharacterized protein LOC119110107 n=1 Tax=Pollicipes pollicipes TaxID=41117 RepID=UPI001884970C|nr:uncharacterized protein LOC119110107 [Pollicipes pollicipes]
MMPRIGLPCLSGALAQWAQQLCQRWAAGWTLAVSVVTLALCSLVVLTQALAAVGTYQGLARRSSPGPPVFCLDSSSRLYSLWWEHNISASGHGTIPPPGPCSDLRPRGWTLL